MLCSLFIKEKLYIGEATVATICGVIFGPHAANLIDPLSWGNADLITVEFSRIVLVVQCFAVGVELPKAYMERHWRSVVFLLVPVMTFGWLMTSLFIWWMIPPLTWLESLIVSACVTATDPVLASSVVGKGKFAKRVPKHLRDVLSAESGCNDGMAFPFIYLSIYLLRYNLEAGPVTKHWICVTILYECILGAIYGVAVGYAARRAIRLCEGWGIIDRESFLVFYFVLALFCAGSGSMLGLDDLLVGFAAGVGFSNDGWFTERTEESHVSNVIDLLLNLTYFVYFGTIIPWDQYQAPDHGITAWRLVVIALLVLFFRRIPIMLACKPLIPDIKTWREALFAGHFGPVGVGAIFAAILARAELETDSTTPLAVLPAPGSHDYELIYLIWPIVTFLVITSILIHGSSIAVFTLGKRINTLTITMSYTQDNDKGAAWMNRLPRISSQGKSMSRMSSFSVDEEKTGLELPTDQLPGPGGLPQNFLRRQKDEDYNKPGSRSSSLKPSKRRKKWDSELGLGGPISASAIKPARREQQDLAKQESQSDTLFEKSTTPSPEAQQGLNVQPPDESAAQTPDIRSRSASPSRPDDDDAEVEAYQEGNEMIIEDEEGNVLDEIDTTDSPDEQRATQIEEVRRRLGKDKSGRFAKHKHEPHAMNEGEEHEKDAMQAAEHPQQTFRKRLEGWKGFGFGKGGDRQNEPPQKKPPHERKRGPAHAYQFGNTIIVEDEDGEVIKKYTLPGPEGGERKKTYGQDQLRRGMQRMGTWVGVESGAPAQPEVPATAEGAADLVKEGAEDNKDDRPTQATKKVDKTKGRQADEPDDGLRMTISRTDRYGLTGLQRQAEMAGGSIALGSGRRLSTRDFLKQMQQLDPKSKIAEVEESDAPDSLKREVKREAIAEREAGVDRPSGRRGETKTGATPAASQKQSGGEDYFSQPSGRQRPYVERMTTHDSVATPTEEIPTHDVRSALVRHGRGETAAEARRRRLATIQSNESGEQEQEDEQAETTAERRRRLNALGIGGGRTQEDSSDEDNEEPRVPKPENAPVPEPEQPAPTTSQRLRVQWGGEKGRERGAGDGEGVRDGARRLAGKLGRHKQ